MLNEKLGEALAWWMRHANSDRRVPKRHLAALLEFGIWERDGDEFEILEPVGSLIMSYGPTVIAGFDAGDDSTPTGGQP